MISCTFSLSSLIMSYVIFEGPPALPLDKDFIVSSHSSFSIFFVRLLYICSSISFLGVYSSLQKSINSSSSTNFVSVIPLKCLLVSSKTSFSSNINCIVSFFLIKSLLIFIDLISLFKMLLSILFLSFLDVLIYLHDYYRKGLLLIWIY